MRQLVLSWIRAKKSLHSEFFFVTFVLERWHVSFSIILLVVQVHDTSSRQKMPTRWREIRIGIQPSDLIFINQIGQIGRVGGAHPFRPPCRRVEALTQVRTAVRRAPHVFFPQLWVCPDRGECRVGVEGPRTLPCCFFFGSCSETGAGRFHVWFHCSGRVGGFGGCRWAELVGLLCFGDADLAELHT
jgi:hypothetical protein